MSYYRQRLQEAMLRSPTPNSQLTTHNFYSRLEAVICAAFLAGWIVAIVTHL